MLFCVQYTVPDPDKVPLRGMTAVMVCRGSFSFRPGPVYNNAMFKRASISSVENSTHAAVTAGSTFLPDFCTVPVVLSLLIVAELLSIVLVLGSVHGAGFSWEGLGIVSLFVQWVALSSAVLLCIGRSWLAGVKDAVAGMICYGLILLVTLLLSEAAYRIMIHGGIDYPAGWHWHMMLRNAGISAIVSAVALRLLYLQHQYRLQLEANANARIEALQARIRPHFLFNSMNTIAALIRQHPQHAEEAVEDLSDLFRASLGSAQEQVTLASELENVRRYLHIEKLRLGERMQVEWDVEGLPGQALLLPLILQPLLENAIYHGVERMEQGGIISITGSCKDDRITITIRNPLPPAQSGSSGSGQQMALNNIRERLQITYGRQGVLQLDKKDDICVVQVTFPLQEYTGS